MKDGIIRVLPSCPCATISISGRDLAAQGLPPGPIYTTIMQTVKRALLNGEVHTRDDQLRLAARLAASVRA